MSGSQQLEQWHDEVADFEGVFPPSSAAQELLLLTTSFLILSDKTL
jgi:hypothetical protein